jgi:hypothetical protein
MNFENTEDYINKWQKILRLMDWDIIFKFIEKDWKKTGDIKIDLEDKNAVILLNKYNPKQNNLEEVIIHELLHLKLYGMDQMIETLIGCVFGKNENDVKRTFAYNQFMVLLESTVNDLAKSFLMQSGDNKEISFGRIMQEIEKEINVENT